MNYKMSRKEVQSRVVEVLRQVGLREESVNIYHHEFSGGQRQRLAIARALGSKPRFIVLDEPVSALDVSIRAQIMNLLKRLKEELGVGYLLIAHDLGTAIHLSHRVEIIYSGKVMESVRASELFHSALHPYTKALVDAASPKQLRELGDKFIVPGEPPDPLNPPVGCRFHPRCFKRIPKCSLDEPQLCNVDDEHMVRCHLY